MFPTARVLNFNPRIDQNPLHNYSEVSLSVFFGAYKQESVYDCSLGEGERRN